MYRISLFIIIILMSTAQVNAQYFNNLYDFDTSEDWGYKIIQKTDGSFGVLGTEKNYATNTRGIMWMDIGSDGTLTGKHSIIQDSCWYEIGHGWAKPLRHRKGYVFPLNQVETQTPYSNFSGGVCVTDGEGDTLFTKFHTDTSNFQEVMWDCDVTENGDIIMAGRTVYKGGGFGSTHGLVRRIDSLGNLKWSKTFTFLPFVATIGSTVQSLENGHTLVQSMSVQPKAKTINSVTKLYTLNRSWYIIFDSLGNQVYQKFVAADFFGTMALKDLQGGYFGFGYQDTFITNNPHDFQNLPTFIARLDDSFNVTWYHSFASLNSKKDPWNVKQLRDSGYIIVGVHKGYDWSATGEILGWAARFSKSGQLLWEQNYAVDTNEQLYVLDAFEESNGDILMTGMHRQSSLPVERGYDVWLFRVDSLGCPSMGCMFPTDVKPVQLPEDIVVYPNPGNGVFTIAAPYEGVLEIYNPEGRAVYKANLRKGNTEVELPAGHAPGVYLGRLTGEGGRNAVIRIVSEGR